jgi:iron complex transport system ATP-binding protein
VNVLEVRDLCFSYGEKSILENINFELRRGELLAVLGANGSGKSTLFRCLLGLDNRYNGKVILEGEDIRGKKPAEMARLMSYVPQKIQSVFNYSVTDMVLMGMTSGGRLPLKRHYEDVTVILKETGISTLADRDFRELSGGEQQLVLIARALAQKARILVMDEPDTGLDYGNQQRLSAKIKELTKSGCSIILSTHNPNQASRFADRVLAIHDRKIAALGAPEVVTEELINTLYGLSPLVIME